MIRVSRKILTFRKAFFKLLLTLFIFTLFSCVESFNYKPAHSEGSYLVVSGGINDLPEKQAFYLSRTTVYGTRYVEYIQGATAQILEYGNVVDQCKGLNYGGYQIDGDKIQPKPGRSYSVRIQLPDGNQYESTPEIMPYPVVPDSANMDVKLDLVRNDQGAYVSQYNIHIKITTSLTANGHPAFLRWNVPEAYSFTELSTGSLSYPKTCYIQEPITDQIIRIFSGGDLSGGKLVDYQVFSRSPSYLEFFYIHYFIVQQYSITRSAYNYWNRLKTVANPSGSFIDTPPAAVIGNIYNVKDKNEPVLGYFEVSSLSIKRIKATHADLLPTTVFNPCQIIYPTPDYCYNCLLLPHSSVDRPAYW